MYFKINKTGVSEYKGLVEVRFDCYLDPLDPGYAEHHVTVPVITEPYPGKVDEMGSPADQAAYKKWLASFPTVTRDNPFCCHFRCFEPDVTDADLVKAGAEILKMAGANHQKGDLKKNTNPKVTFTTNLSKITASLNRVEAIKATDFSKVVNLSESKVL
jgi:hypothetical protein